MVSETEIVYLDTMDGFEFESFCERLFKKLEWGEVERIGMIGDGGRDILIHTNEGTIVIECKHHPNSSIGRPVVQKLHSAVISSGAKKGILITTGKFTKEATIHAKEISEETPIQLYDFHRLTDLANKASIKIVLGGIVSQIYCFPFKNINDIKETFRSGLDKYQSFPKSAFDLMKLIPHNLVLSSAYLINAEISQNFTTSVGLIHSMHEENLFLLFDAKTGNLISQDINCFLKNVPLQEFKELPKIACKIIRQNFDVDVTNLNSMAKQLIRTKFSKIVHYTGMNNVSYSKECVPNLRNIRINNTNQVFIPLYYLEFHCKKQLYPCHVIVKDTEIHFMKIGIFTCQICLEKIKVKKLLCNDCGNITHSPKFFRSHSFVCKNCKKTICKNCTFYWRKMLFFKKILCEECSNIKPKVKKKLVKIK